LWVNILTPCPLSALQRGGAIQRVPGIFPHLYEVERGMKGVSILSKKGGEKEQIKA